VCVCVCHVGLANHLQKIKLRQNLGQQVIVQGISVCETLLILRETKINTCFGWSE